MKNAFGLQRVVIPGLANKKNTDERRESERVRESQRAGGWVFCSLQPAALKGPEPSVSSTIYREVKQFHPC